MRLGAGWALPWLPTIGAIQGFDFIGDGSAAEKEDLRYDPATQTAVMTEPLATGTDYVIDTVLADTRATRDVAPSTALDDDLYDQAAFLDPAVLGWSLGAESPMDAVLRVAEHLRQEGRYSDDESVGQSVERLGPGFLLTTPSVGNDEQYAAAMALMANRLKVPARVVVGAVLPKSGIVKGKDVEAWVELRAADGTWLTLATDRFMSHRPPSQREPGGNAPTGLPGGDARQRVARAAAGQAPAAVGPTRIRLDRTRRRRGDVHLPRRDLQPGIGRPRLGGDHRLETPQRPDRCVSTVVPQPPHPVREHGARGLAGTVGEYWVRAMNLARTQRDEVRFVKGVHTLRQLSVVEVGEGRHGG